MGWCSGTDLFDKVIEAIPEESRTVELFEKIIDAFEQMDWDCQMESDYSGEPNFRAAFKHLNPDWNEEVEDGQ
jgi:hypothetical protein